MVTTSTQLTLQAWRMLNLLWKRHMFTASRTVGAILESADAESSDLADVIERELVYARSADPDAEPDKQLTADLLRAAQNPHASLTESHVAIALTGKGLHWVGNNKANLALFQFLERRRWQGVFLVDVQEAIGADRDVLIGLDLRGLITCVTGFGLPVELAKHGKWRREDEFRGRITPAGLRVIDAH